VVGGEGSTSKAAATGTFVIVTGFVVTNMAYVWCLKLGVATFTESGFGFCKNAR
jgi:hypothetical protein